RGGRGRGRARRRLQRDARRVGDARRARHGGVALLAARPRDRPGARPRRRRRRAAAAARRLAAARRRAPVGSCARAGRDRMSWQAERARFPVLARRAYLNAGTFGPLSQETLAAMAEVRAYEGEHGRSGRAYFDAMLERCERVRALLAAEIGVPADRVALTASTTQGVQIAVLGLELGPGDEVVTTDAEHFGLIGPLAASGASLRFAPVRQAR